MNRLHLFSALALRRNMSNLKLLSEVSLPQSHQAPEIYVQNWTNLAMPSRMRVDHRTLTSSYGRFTIEPLEQGYAVTLGHSLRKPARFHEWECDRGCEDRWSEKVHR